LIGRFGKRGWIAEQEMRSAVFREVATVFEQAPLVVVERAALRERPLDAARAVEHDVVFDAGNVTGAATAEPLEDLEYRFGALPFAKQVGAAPSLGHELEDVEIGQRLAGRSRHAFEHP